MARHKRKDLDDDYEAPQKKGEVVPFNKADMQEKVKAYVERIQEHNSKFELLRTSKASLMQEAVSAGLDKKILTKIVKLMNKPTKANESEAELTKLYAEAVGLQLDFGF